MKPAFSVQFAIFLIALANAFMAHGQGSAPVRDGLRQHARSQMHMAVDFEVVLYAQSDEAAEAAFAKAFARIAELDKKLSDYDSASELSRLSATSQIGSLPPGTTNSASPAVRLTNDLWTLLSESQQLSGASAGAFDVTIGPLTKLWRRARRWKELPDAPALAAAREAVGYQHLHLDPAQRTARLLRPNMRLDLGGIGKGFAAEQAAIAAAATGVRRVLVRGSGDIVALDPPPQQRGWRVGLAPLNPEDPPARFVELANCAISTSGDARQHLIVDGRRYSHIIDPRTGEPISGRSSVSVIALHGSLADGLATAASVLGPDAALSLTKNYEGAELMTVYEDASGQRRTVESPGFRKYDAAMPEASNHDSR
jgi:thiamine biosynthesis lipoprotein